ncbi:MAG: response regulator transcription factor [Lachnospiraceae bacterium]|nr:response regulator transcription factor [Lachnospiraceae bacterium]
MDTQKIFVIEDDENIRELVKVALEGYGYRTETFETAEAALACIEAAQPALAVFDLMLPGMDGLSAIRQIRDMKKVKDIPIIVLTAKDKEYDKVVGLDGGADDYMTKPFGVLELAARVRSLLRRSTREAQPESGEKLTLGRLTVDMAAREVYVGEHKIVLTYKEYELLTYLMENRMRVVPREELLDKLWDYNADIETRTLDIHIRTLRQKLGEEGSAYIRTVRSVGYRFCIPE